MISKVLPESGRVLGIDVGYSPMKRTTGFCCLSWTEDRLCWSESTATADPVNRERSLREVLGQDKTRVLAVAVDGPLKPGLQRCSTYRTAECVLSRGAFQKRGKPGQTSSPVGQQLHKHATLLGSLVLANCAVDPAQMPFSASSASVYEAFPNLFLGVLCDERDYPTRPAKHRCWTDCLFQLVGERVNDLIKALLPGREFKSIKNTEGHERVAALTCAVTALAVGAGQCVAVGAPTDGYIILPPLSIWGLSDERERWAQRELRNNFFRLSFEKSSMEPPKIYCGPDPFELSKS